MVSTDSVNWLRAASIDQGKAHTYFNAVEYVLGEWVSVGTYRTIITSQDGFKWKVCFADPATDIFKIKQETYHGPRFPDIKF
jgi:hypothetical protein